MDARYSVLEEIESDYVLTTPERFQYHFDRLGRLERLVNAAGHTLEVQRNAAGWITEIREPVTDISVRLAYDERGYISEISDTAWPRFLRFRPPPNYRGPP